MGWVKLVLAFAIQMFSFWSDKSAVVRPRLSDQKEFFSYGTLNAQPGYDIAIADCNTEKAASGGGYIATCVYDSYDGPPVWTLRRYRDNTLANGSGQAIRP